MRPMESLCKIAARFVLDGEATEVKPLGEGFINDTYTVALDGNPAPRYILQRKNLLSLAPGVRRPIC